MSDIRIHECSDGGDFILTDGGDLQEENGFFTAIYLTLFEGKTFYNLFDDDNTESINFEDVLKTEINKTNLNKIASTAVLKLDWMIKDGLCEKITASATAGKVLNSIYLEITTIEQNNILTKYGLLWDKTQSELKYIKEVK